MDTIEINGKSFEAAAIPTPNSNILLIKTEQGFLGCGYFDIATADKLNEAVAIVTGVTNYDEMLEAKVVRMSKAASECGVIEGMSGQEALLKLT
ncbi:MAG: DUF1805 domain-containing protein [Candidatus Melainabacteria bacterium]|jgi:uncharacterized protein YunC (DUF1805 family)|nr:DUF1805 domain-containing protein [Candidatus Melainabacteria bacterium]